VRAAGLDGVALGAFGLEDLGALLFVSLLRHGDIIFLVPDELAVFNGEVGGVCGGLCAGLPPLDCWKKKTTIHDDESEGEGFAEVR
jgi:hypothetical protein